MSVTIISREPCMPSPACQPLPFGWFVLEACGQLMGICQKSGRPNWTVTNVIEPGVPLFSPRPEFFRACEESLKALEGFDFTISALFTKTSVPGLKPRRWSFCACHDDWAKDPEIHDSTGFCFWQESTDAAKIGVFGKSKEEKVITFGPTSDFIGAVAEVVELVKGS